MITRPKTVFTNGCFCLFHDGHRHFLREAAKGAELFIVAINTDASMERLKGVRPVDSLVDRVARVSAFLKEFGIPCGVLTFNEDTPEIVIHDVRPDVLVHGDDAPHPWPGEEFVRQCGGEIREVQRLPGISTTELLNQTP